MKLFISDLHLDESEPVIAKIFLHFLKKLAPKASALYILGDLFEAWVGDDCDNGFVDEIKSSLRSLTDTGFPIYIMPGNRDFLLGTAFAQKTGCRLLTDPTVIELYGQRILLMHGDSLCTLDKHHQLFRSLTCKPWVQQLFLQFPLSWRVSLAHWLRKRSAQHTKSLTTQMMDVSDTAVKAIMEKYQVSLLIHGHTHRPAIHHLELNLQSQLNSAFAPSSDQQFTLGIPQPAVRIVLAAWHKQGNMLQYAANGEYKLCYFNEMQVF